MSGRSFRDHLTWPPSLDTVWLLSPAFALTTAAWLTPIRPFDYFWALVQGRATLQLGGIARENTFLYTLPEQAPFFNQPWLGQLILYGGHRLGGHSLNLVLLALLLVAALVWSMDAALRQGARPLHVALVALASLPLVALGSGVRTQMFAYPCFALVFRQLLLDGPHASRSRLLLSSAVAAFWANVHGSFVLAPALIAVRGIVLVAKRPDAGESRRLVARSAAFEFAAVVAATCLNPRGPAIYAYVARLGGAMGVERGTDVAEWQPLSLLDPLAWLLLVAIGTSVVFALGRRGRVELSALLVFLALSVLCFTSQRFLGWAALSGIAIVSVLLRAESSPAVEPRRGVAWLNLGLLVFLGAVMFASLPGAPLFNHFAPCAHVPYADSRALGKETPIRTAERLARDGHSGRIFHHQAVAGVLEWTLAADRPKPVAFVDQRFELTPPSLWQEYFTIARARPGFRKLLDRYGIGTLLVDEHDQRPLVEAIAKDAEWRLVSQEFSYRLYMRSAPVRPTDG